MIKLVILYFLKLTSFLCIFLMLIFTSVSFSSDLKKNTIAKFTEHKAEDESVSEGYYNFLVKYCKDKQKSPDSCYVYNAGENGEYKTLLENLNNKRSVKSSNIEKSNEKIRLALDILNYIHSGNKSDRIIIATDETGECTFYNINGRFLYYFDHVIPSTLTIDLEGNLVFSGDLVVMFTTSDLVHRGDNLVDVKAEMEYGWTMPGWIIMSKSTDYDRAVKAVSLLFEKACKGAQSSEF